MGPGFFVLLSACVASAFGHLGSWVGGLPGNAACCQTPSSACCQGQTTVTTTAGPWTGYTLSPAATGSFRGNASYFPPNWTGSSNVLALPPIGIPSLSVLLPNGAVRFPNGTSLLTVYAAGTVPPVARLPSGVLMFPNGTVATPGTVATFPPPGFPLNATAESSTYPPLYLPPVTFIFHNGSLVSPGGLRINTVFTRGFVANCPTLLCHHVPAG